jgi:hypothetical protein
MAQPTQTYATHPDLTRRALSGDLKTQGDIKRAIRNGRADHLRV